MTLQGKTAFVSGSGSNIGRATAVGLAERGAALLVNGSANREACEETVELCRKAGAKAEVVMGDVGNAETVAAMREFALSSFGRVDIVVNNAAIRPLKPFLEMSDGEWQHVIATNLHSVFHVCRAFLPGMIEVEWGRIVNFAGLNAMQGYGAGGSAVSASKHAVWGLTKALAKEFGRSGITANVVSPGPIRREGKARAGHHPAPDRLKDIAVGHMGETRDIAELVGFLCSDSSKFITGQMIACNGGAQT